ncbi:hypothetical protein POM88_051000 [Heracleum sosnowskyi]|uniref:Uncharacterized protein n=1 Tax=Heracleum sosnowskyi TaxID=360622 RepID=A0AAD8GZN2_9APIA|nr:hypothetical protein POM88_051000 [Heracleum sosnowskyi]
MIVGASDNVESNFAQILVGFRSKSKQWKKKTGYIENSGAKGSASKPLSIKKVSFALSFKWCIQCNVSYHSSSSKFESSPVLEHPTMQQLAEQSVLALRALHWLGG